MPSIVLYGQPNGSPWGGGRGETVDSGWSMVELEERRGLGYPQRVNQATEYQHKNSDLDSTAAITAGAKGLPTLNLAKVKEAAAAPDDSTNLSSATRSLVGHKPASARSPTTQYYRAQQRIPLHHQQHQQQQQSGAAPMTPSVALKAHSHALTEYEQSECLEYPSIYFLGASADKVRGMPGSNAPNCGYDDERGEYSLVLGDHIAYRYEVKQLLGSGSFGQVVKVFDHKYGTTKALKVIRNKRRFHQQALVEVKILEHLQHNDPEDSCNLVHMQEYFYFRNHLCLTFEVLSMNLYEFIRNNNFAGVSMGLIRRFAQQMLSAVAFLNKQSVVHCDLKPENVLLKHPTRSSIKVIDFGSSCFEDERVYTYIQSRFYRAPEVLLGLPYGTMIDIWSFACILAELHTGFPLFPGEDEHEQMACIMEVLGTPPQHIIEASSRRKVFFDSNNNPRLQPNSRGKRRRPGAKDLASATRSSDQDFLSLLDACLRWDPRERITPEEALRHPWFASTSTAATAATPRPAPALATVAQTNLHTSGARTERTGKTTSDYAAALHSNHMSNSTAQQQLSYNYRGHVKKQQQQQQAQYTSPQRSVGYQTHREHGGKNTGTSIVYGRAATHRVQYQHASPRSGLINARTQHASAANPIPRTYRAGDLSSYSSLFPPLSTERGHAQWKNSKLPPSARRH